MRSLIAAAATMARQEVYRRRLIQRPLRRCARLAIRRGRVASGVTVVIANWNSAEYLQVVVDLVRLRSDPDTRITVVDNHSTDSSRAYLASRRDVRAIKLPYNVGHEVALDVGFLQARTEYVIALDVDAFPLSDQWIQELVARLEGGARVAGAHVRGGFVHPCCLAMRFRDFVEGNHSFTAVRGPKWAVHADDVQARGWDTGWSISLREPRRSLIDRTEVRGPGDIGSVFGNVVYHNFYSVRVNSSKFAPTASERADGITATAARAAWNEALQRFGPNSQD